MDRRIFISLAALAASSTLALAAPDGAGKPDSAQKASPPSASDVAPGQKRGAGESARDVAPGQVKPDGQSAKEYAPGQTKDDADAKPKGNDRKSDAGDAKDRRSGADAGSSKAEGRVGATESGRKGGSIAEVSTEQKTKVRSAFTRHRVEPAKIDLSINIGVAIPRDVRLYPIPQDIIVIAPAYREYRYFIIGDRVCVVDPVTYEIVDIIILT